MALELPIAVYGNGELYQELFNAIAAALGDTAYSYLIKLTLCLTGTWAIIRYSAERSLMPLAKWLITYYIAFYVIFMPKVTVEILDQVNQGQAYTVDNVPLGLAAVANLTSSLGAGLTELMEKTFSLPDDLKYEKTGMIMASRLVLASTQFQVTDPDFQQSLQSFVHQCIFYDVLMNKYSWNDLLTATNIWNFVGNYASPARAFAYYQSGNTQIITCKEGFTLLNNAWKNAIEIAAARYGTRLFPDAQDAKTQLLSYLPDSYQFLTNISDDGVTIMQQNMVANALQEGILQMGASTNSPAALEAYSFTKAQQQKRLTNYTVGDMAAYWIPIMKNVLEATLYGSFTFVFLLLLFPFGASIFKNYIASLMWIQLWAPLYAILNLFLSFYAQKHSLGALNLGNGSSGLTLSTQAGLAQVNADVAGLAGYLLLSVPLLAAGIVKGLMSVFTQAAQYIAGVTQGAASGAAGDAVAGNLSLGNTSFSNHSAYNTSANHFDSNARVFGGMYTSQMPGGSSVSLTPGGSIVMNTQSGISNLGTSINVADTIRTAAMQQAEASQTSALSYGHAYVESTANSLRKLYDLAHQQGITAQSGESSSITLSGGLASAVGHVQRLTERFAHNHNISYNEAAQVLGNTYLTLQGGGHFSTDRMAAGKAFGLATGLSASADLNAGHSQSWQNSHGQNSSEIYSAAKDFIHDTNYSQNVETALRGVSEHSYRASTEDGQRLMDSISNSYEQSVQSRQDMQSSLNMAQSYREAASYAEEHADTINSNASQPYFEYLQNTHSGDLRSVETMQTNDPMAGQAAGQDFMNQYAHHYLEEWKQSHISSATVEANYENNNVQISGSNDIQKVNEVNQASLIEQAHEKGVDKKNIVDASIKNKADELLLQSQKQVSDKQTTIIQGGKEISNNFNAKVSKKLD